MTINYSELLKKLVKPASNETFEEHLFTPYYCDQLEINNYDSGYVTEKAQVVRALEDYVKNKPEQKVEIDKTQWSINKNSESYILKIADSFSETSYKAIKQKVSSSPYFDKTDNLNQLIYFVADKPRQYQENEYRFKSFNGDCAELFQKMVGAMKIGDKFKTALISHENDYNFTLDESSDENRNFILADICKTKPKLVVTLGATATTMLLDRKEKLSSIHGQFIKRTINWLDMQCEITFSPLFHPEYLLINSNMKKTAWEDMQKMMKFLGVN